MGAPALAAGALLALTLTQTIAVAIQPGNVDAVLNEARNYDRRLDLNAGLKAAAADAPLALAAVSPLAAARDLTLTRDDDFGTVHTVTSPLTYVTAARKGEDPMTIAREFVGDPAMQALLGLSADDLLDYEVTDIVFSQGHGRDPHLPAPDLVRACPVYNAQLHINVNRDGRILSVNNSFVPGTCAPPVTTWSRARPGRRGAERGRRTWARLDGRARVLEARRGRRRRRRVDAAGASPRADRGRLVWLPVRARRGAPGVELPDRHARPRSTTTT